VWDIEHRYLGVDGQWHHILSRGVPVRDEGGRICCWAGINLDINRQKHLEAALKREAGRKDDFLALLGHELRNPLAPISLAVDLIRAAGRDPAAIEPACAIVERQVAHMVRLVDDLLDVARIARGKFQLRKDVIDLAAAVRGVLEDYRPVFAENGLALETELAPGPVWMEADKARITQAVSNLLHNAIKFTDRGGRVAVTLAVEEGAWAQVRVRDTGIGIPPDLLPSMFEPFMQNQATIGRARGGLGLGLALIKGLVAMHGGTVSAMSEGPGMGSGFTLRLPVRRAQAGPAPEAPAPGGPVPVPGRPRRILIVEDFQDAAITLKRLLELQGHTVAIAADGRTGLDLADSFGPEIILCDIGLPGQRDGYGVARAIREAPRLKDIYLVALTGFGTPEDKVKAIRAGFDLHLTKPVAPVALERLILGIPQVGAWRLRTCSATPTGSAPATP
jgi:signal transduction histidine kinase/CheY-like chemotaxis protein